MTVVNDYAKWGEAVKYESYSDFNRDVGTVVSGSGELETTTLLGTVTASGKFAPHDPTAGDGTETASAILYTAVDATAADQEAVVLIRGHAIIDFDKLTLVNALDAGQTTAAKAALLALGIKSSEGV